jgi:hypothetical protein
MPEADRNIQRKDLLMTGGILFLHKKRTTEKPSRGFSVILLNFTEETSYMRTAPIHGHSDFCNLFLLL